MIKALQSIIIVLLLMFIWRADHAARAQETGAGGAGSLLFSANEKRAIEAALAQRPDSAPAEQLQLAEGQPGWKIERLQLSALLYYGPQKWALWFGDRQVRQDTAPPYLADLHVTANFVDLSVIPQPGAAPVHVRLRPNQTFLTRQLRIAEGSQAGN